MLAWRGEPATGDAAGLRRQRRQRPRAGDDRRAAAAAAAPPRARRRPSHRRTSRWRKGAVFVEPALVAEVRYTEVTEKGLLRQPVLVRSCGRQDASPSATDAATPSAPSDHAAVDDRRSADRPLPPPRSPATAPAISDSADDPTAAAPRFTLSNLDKVFWPAEGYTKGDLLDYYDRHLAGDRAVPARSPGRADALSGRHRRQELLPEERARLRPRLGADLPHRGHRVLRLQRARRAALRHQPRLHSAARVERARRQSIEHPDWAILDLDPEGRAASATCVAVARHIHAMLEPLDVPHFIKTSGQDGLHILIPLGGALTHDEATAFAEVLARLVAAELPEIATVARQRRRARRQGLRRLPAERPRQDDRGAVLGAAAARRAGVDAARVVGGDAPASTRRASPSAPCPPRLGQARRSAARRCSTTRSTSPRCWRR